MRTLAAVFLGLALFISAAGAEDARPVEHRGAWVWARSCPNKVAADAMLARAEAMNLNALYVLVFHWGATAAYHSAILPVNDKIEEGFDPLGYLVAEGHRRGMEIHTWYVNGPCTSQGGAAPWIFQKYPNWRTVNRGGQWVEWFDLCQPAVRDWQTRIMLEVLQKYDVDGVHFDYIRFNGRGICACASCREAMRRQTGFDLSSLCYAALPAYGSFNANPLAEPTTARILVQFDNGVPAVAVNKVGSGRVVLFNWQVEDDPSSAVNRLVLSAFEQLGTKPGDLVLILDSDINAKKYEHRAFQDARRWIGEFGFRTKRVGDNDLAKLPKGAVVVLPGFYLMQDDQAKALLAHVRAGGGAVFFDGPVRAMKSEAARTLLGFARTGRYFHAGRILLPGPDAEGWIPRHEIAITTDTESVKMEKWDAWRKDQITKLVAQVSHEAKATKPDRLVTAAVFRTKTAADNVLQDWPRWLREGLLDYVIPMSYVATAAELDQHFAWWKSLDPQLERIIPAVGAFKIIKDRPAEERARAVAEQIEVCRRQGAHGVVMFNLEGIDDATASRLGQTVFATKTRPYRPKRK